MSNTGRAPQGRVYTAKGNLVPPSFLDIGTYSGLSVHGVLLGQGLNPFIAAVPAAAGTVLMSNGPGVDPSFQSGGTSIPNTITGQSGGALSPTAGNWNISGGTTAAGTAPLTTSGSGSTLTINAQISQAIASTDVTKIGLSNFNSTYFSVDANGFVSLVSPLLMSWVDATGATQALAVNTGYVTDHSATVIYTLPATAVLGDRIKIVGKLGLATITPNANQQILIGSGSGAVGVTGTAVSNNVGDCLELICITAGASTVYRADSVVGTWTLN